MITTAATEKGAETRRRLVEAAGAAFMERGYAATSMSDLIVAAGLTKGGFYFHFPSKRAVAIEFLRLRQAQMRDQALSAAGEHERGSEQVAAMVRALAHGLEAKGERGMGGIEALCKELRGDGVDDPVVARPHEPWIAAAADLFRRAQEQGDMDADMDPVAAARFAVGAFVGMEDMARTDPGAGGLLGMSADDYLRFVSRAVGLRIPSLT